MGKPTGVGQGWKVEGWGKEGVWGKTRVRTRVQRPPERPWGRARLSDLGPHSFPETLVRGGGQAARAEGVHSGPPHAPKAVGAQAS